MSKEPQWEVWYDLEAANYLSDNGELVTELFFAMEALADTKGVPPATEYEFETSRYLTILNNHIITYTRNTTAKVITISTIQPVPTND